MIETVRMSSSAVRRTRDNVMKTLAIVWPTNAPAPWARPKAPRGRRRPFAKLLSLAAKSHMPTRSRARPKKRRREIYLEGRRLGRTTGAPIRRSADGSARVQESSRGIETPVAPARIPSRARPRKITLPNRLPGTIVCRRVTGSKITTRVVSLSVKRSQPILGDDFRGFAI